MRATEHTQRGPFGLLERCLGLAEIIERRAGVIRVYDAAKKTGFVKTRVAAVLDQE